MLSPLVQFSGGRPCEYCHLGSSPMGWKFGSMVRALKAHRPVSNEAPWSTLKHLPRCVKMCQGTFLALILRSFSRCSECSTEFDLLKAAGRNWRLTFSMLASTLPDLTSTMSSPQKRLLSLIHLFDHRKSSRLTTLFYSSTFEAGSKKQMQLNKLELNTINIIRSMQTTQHIFAKWFSLPVDRVHQRSTWIVIQQFSMRFLRDSA